MTWWPEPPACPLAGGVDGERDGKARREKISRGYPRAINNIATQALIAAFATNKTIVDESSARTAITEVTSE